MNAAGFYSMHSSPALAFLSSPSNFLRILPFFLLIFFFFIVFFTDVKEREASYHLRCGALCYGQGWLYTYFCTKKLMFLQKKAGGFSSKVTGKRGRLQRIFLPQKGRVSIIQQTYFWYVLLNWAGQDLWPTTEKSQKNLGLSPWYTPLYPPPP